MSKQVEKMGTPAVRQANALAKSAQLMEMNEKRLVFLAMSRIRWDDEDFLTCELPLVEIQQWFGGNPYQEVRRTADNLLKRVVHVMGEEGHYKKFQWTTLAEYIPASRHSEGISAIRLRFNSELKPYLLMLRDRYNTVPLKPLLLLPSFNAQRLYEVLWHDSHAGKKQFLTYDIGELKTFLGLRDPNGRWEKYEQWRDLRKLLLRLQEAIEVIGPLRIRRFVGLKSKSRSYNRVRFELSCEAGLEMRSGAANTFVSSEETLSPEFALLARDLREAGYNQDPLLAVEQYGFEVVQRTLKLARKAERDSATTRNPIRNLGGLIARMLQRGAATLDLENEKPKLMSREDAAQRARELQDSYSIALADAATAFWDELDEDTQQEILALMRVELNTQQIRVLDRSNWTGPSFISSRNGYLYRTYPDQFPTELQDLGIFIRTNGLLTEYGEDERQLVYKELERL